MRSIRTLLLCTLFACGYTQSSAQNVKIENELTAAKKKTGNQLIVSNGDTKLYAVIKDGKVEKYTATGKSGEDLKVTTMAKKAVCSVCIYTPSGNMVCYTVSCSDIPRPTTKITQRN